MVGNAHSMIEITACNLAIITLLDLHMVGADHEFITTQQYAYCAHEGQGRNVRVVGYIYTQSCQPVRLLISVDTRRNRGREYRYTRILHDNEACLIDEKFILRIIRSMLRTNSSHACEYFILYIFGNCIIIMLFKSLKVLFYIILPSKICRFTCKNFLQKFQYSIIEL